ncbi:MAG: hypothetical protein U0V64_14740 [Cyclobacteriaceae bacterium]
MVKLVLLVFFLPVACFAQRIEHQQAEARNEQIIITYDLVTGKAGDKYRVHLYSSHNNFSFPVTRVSGNIVALENFTRL